MAERVWMVERRDEREKRWISLYHYDTEEIAERAAVLLSYEWPPGTSVRFRARAYVPERSAANRPRRQSGSRLASGGGHE